VTIAVWFRSVLGYSGMWPQLYMPTTISCMQSRCRFNQFISQAMKLLTTVPENQLMSLFCDIASASLVFTFLQHYASFWGCDCRRSKPCNRSSNFSHFCSVVISVLSILIMSSSLEFCRRSMSRLRSTRSSARFWH
jgi:hypothetical protein